MTNSLRALIYGATGYIGGLCARRAAEAGLAPVLAGRDFTRLARLGQALKLETAVFALDDAAAVRSALQSAAVVLNCAGPFDLTTPALITACLETGVHYLDLAGEVPEFQVAEARHEDAVRAGVMLLPGAGFGVVPTDCLAARVHRRLPDADRLHIAFQTVGGLSRGTAATLLRDLSRPGVRRQNGAYVPQRAAAATKTVDFGSGPVKVTTNPWRADLVTAVHSTGIATIDAYTALPGPVRALMRLAGRHPRPFRTSAWNSTISALIRRLPSGPDETALAKGSSHILAVADAPNGTSAASILHGPQAYEFTARTATAIMARVLSNDAIPGFQTPAAAYGPELITGIGAVTVIDL